MERISPAYDTDALATLTHDVLRRLEAAYGRPRWQPVHSPLDELILTILSQHTSDVNSERAFAELRRRFPEWAMVRDAPVEEVANAIRSGGLADVKARRIQQVLTLVLEDGAPEPLAELRTLALPEAKARLTSLPGVGPKTAACVLLFACGRPALPVDTHVHRVAGRIGLIDERVSAEQAHEQLERLLAPGDVYSFHLMMITHGRRICHARAPQCSVCPVRDLCRYYRATHDGTNDTQWSDDGH